MRVRGEGPIPTRIMLVGEFPSPEDERAGLAFQGGAGMELARMLGEAGLMRSECYATHALRLRPPNGALSVWMPFTKREIT
ncbi:uracil-DNA glycosylase family protein, partial [Listeria monocytogenes]|uniref:uracil-DNA glycosylase family protein n=1 Tax=Listeria monocytogenes TaxID=1639 RepID=UPI003C6D30B3